MGIAIFTLDARAGKISFGGNFLPFIEKHFSSLQEQISRRRLLSESLPERDCLVRLGDWHRQGSWRIFSWNSDGRVLKQRSL
jgi:hypothetical protein